MTPESTAAGVTAAADAPAVADAGPVVKPSKIAITKMLAEAEVARRRALKPWLLALLLPVLLGAALIGFSSYAVSVRLAKIKDLDREIAEKEKLIKERDKTIAAQNAQAENLTNGLNRAFVQLDKNPEAKQEVINALTSNQTAAATTPRVFIQIHDEEQRAKAHDVAQALKGSGLIVPGIERRPEKVAFNQVKYFRQEDNDAAHKAAAIMAGQGFADAKSVFVDGLKAPPGQLEVWFAPATQTPTPTPTAPQRTVDLYTLERQRQRMVASQRTEDSMLSSVVAVLSLRTDKKVNPNSNLKDLGISDKDCVGLTSHLEDIFRIKPNAAAASRRLCSSNPTVSDVAHYLYVENSNPQ